ncbi:MAG: hypothetical protein WCY51_01785 [Sulfurimonas sp.]|uniref:hypothetical protein n=1 Tax=Sulfurimonas sp. TaxID=2022749 RepID=UPI0025DA3F00|nr:hypothetical protein [Sulfurimonas sp.]MCK9454692.1 hypothetical protein [Sulfurimonas sp.]
MEFNGDILTIDIGMSMEEVEEFQEFIRPRIDYIETIEADEDDALRCSALLALLVSLKRTKPELNIPFLEKKKLVSQKYGTIHWICHD